MSRGPEHPARRPLLLLQQGAAVIRALEPELYTARTETSPQASVGSHFRHCLDYHTCLLDGLTGGRVDYDRRPRETALEQDPELALARAARLSLRWEEILGWDASMVLEVRHDAEGEAWAASSLGRECAFLASHTVHHFALMASLLRALGAAVADDFGVSCSTLRHWRSLARESR